MSQYFVIKRSDAWFWRGKMTREQALDQLRENQLGHDWLVCPLGCAHHAVTIAEFAQDPKVFHRLERKDAAERRRREASAASVEMPPLRRWGGRLIQFFFTCLLVGGAIVRVFFPNMLGVGFTPVTLGILIPIWSIGAIGLVSWLAGWIQHRLKVRSALSAAAASAPPGSSCMA